MTEKDAIGQYLTSLRRPDVPATTYDHISGQLKRFNQYMSQQFGLDLHAGSLPQVTTAHVNAYYAALVAMELKPASLNNYASILRTFFCWHQDQKHITDNPAQSLPHIKRKYAAASEKPDESKYYSTAQVQIMLDCLAHQSSAVQKRDAALFVLMLASAMRVSEACSLTVRKYMQLRQTGNVEIVGKGGGRQLVEVADYAFAYMDAYLATRSNASEDEPLFMSQKGRPLTRVPAWKALARIQRQIELPTGTHILRHTAVTFIALKHGIVIARDAARHRSVTTTNNYAHRVPAVVRNAVQSSPLAELFTARRA